MTEADINDWIGDKKNLGKVVEDFFNDQPKLAFFMAGIPGAGKTEFVDNLKRRSHLTNFVIIEHDKLVEYLPGYRPENYYAYRRAGNPIVSSVFKKCLEHGRSFIMDGTLAHGAGADNIRKTLKKGYRVVVVYIVLDPDAAWAITEKREKVTKRNIERSGFIKTCNAINEKLLDIFTTHLSDSNFRFFYLDKKDSVKPSASHEILASTDRQQAAEIRKRLAADYNIS
ncbi:AAA family ATPase [Candidatus Saccharibacteria bacterium]|nr:AAA family ATPase [Candidatus Saccharibacteria bacterium]